MNRPARRLRFLPGVLLLPIALGAGCASPSRPSPRERPAAEADAVDENQFRATLYSYGDEFSAVIQDAASAIVDATNDPDVRRRTVEWKLRSVPSLRRIVLGKDSRSAFVDAWTYTVQMRFYLEEGEGAGLFGPQQAIAVKATHRLEERIEAVAASVLPRDQIDRAREAVRTYARENPIRTAIAGRPSLPSSESKGGTMTWLVNAPLSILNPFKGIDEGAQAIREFAEVAAGFTEVVESIPETLSWQVELLLYDVERRETVLALTESLRTFSESAASLAETARRLPEDVEGAVAKTLEEIEAREASFRDTMGEARRAIESANAPLESAKELATSLERTADAATRTAEAWEATARALGLGGDEAAGAGPPDSGDEGGFDPKEYADAADRLTDAAAEIRGLVREVRDLAGSKEMGSSIEGLGSLSRSAVDHLAWRVLQLLGAALLAAIVYRFVSAGVSRYTKGVRRPESTSDRNRRS